MWLLFGVAAIITAMFNIIFTVTLRNAQWFRFASLSFTALTLCGFLRLFYGWIIAEDWSALMDVVGVSKLLIILTVASILLNSISLLLPLLKKK